MFHYVYVITNTVNGKIYVGKHSTENLDDGYMGSGGKLTEAKRVFGIDKFEKRILQMCDSEEEAYEFESLIVDEEFLKRDDVYNVIPGGIRTCATSSEFVKALWKNPEYRENVLSTRRDRHVLISEKQRDVALRLWKNPEYRNLMQKRARDSWKNTEYRDKNVTAQKIAQSKMSLDKKQKIAKAVSLAQTGENNSQYGKAWVYHNQLRESKRVLNSDVEKFLEMGWSRGRKMKWIV